MKHSLFNTKLTATSLSILFSILLLQAFSVQANAATETPSWTDTPMSISSDIVSGTLIAEADDDDEMDEDDVEHFDEDELPDDIDIEEDVEEEEGPPPTKD